MGETDLCVLVKEVEVCTACVCKFFAVVDRLTASADGLAPATIELTVSGKA